MQDMYICICNSVTDRDIRAAVEAGAGSLDDLRDRLGVASCCGSCACDAEALLGTGAGGGEPRPVRAPSPAAAPVAAAVVEPSPVAAPA